MSNEAWKRALRALSALCVDPVGLKGMTVRARPSPARQVLEDQFAHMPLPPCAASTPTSLTRSFLAG